MSPTSNTAARVAAFAAFLAMAALGWNLGGEAKAPAAETATSAAVSSKTTKRPERGNGRYGTPAHVRAAMKTIREAGSPEARMRATIELANTLPVGELEAWLEGRWFDTGDGFDLTLFNKIAKQRWRQEDPEGLIVWGLKNGSMDATSILNEWAAGEPQRVIDFFREHPNDQLELRSLAEVAKSNPALAMGRLQELMAQGMGRNGNASSYYVQELLVQLAAKSPAVLEAALDSLPGHWQDKVEAALVGERLKTSFSEEIRKLWERPDGWKLFAGRGGRGDGVGEKLLGELANLPASWKSSLASSYNAVMDSANAEKWITADLEGSGFTTEQAGQIRKGALQYMSYNNPEGALKLLKGMELGDEERWNVIGNTFSHAARNPEKTEELMALLDSDADRKVAQSRLDQSSHAQAATKVEQPADWLAQAGALKPDAGSSYQIMSMLEDWDKEKISDLKGQFIAMPDEGKRTVAEMLAGKSYGSDQLDPSLQAEAIRYLVANPEETAGQGSRNDQLASMHAVKWAAKDPVAASEWVQTLPAGDGRLWAQKNLAKNWAQYDPDAAGQWAASLPADARAEVQAFMKKGAGE